MRLFTIAFVTKSYGRGVAVVAAHDADEAYTVLVSYGQLNHSPEEYGEILDIKDSGCSSFNVPTLLEEELTAIKVIIGEPGNDGKSIYELCIANGTFEGTEEEFVAEYNAAVAKAEVAVKEEEKRKAAEISREQNTKEALKNMSVALEKVNTAIVNADTAAEKTNEVISTANTAAENAKTQAANAETATSNAESATEKANNAAINADNSRKAIEQNTAVVKTSEQTLTEEQQVQARENIGIGTVLTDIASTQAALSVAEQDIATLDDYIEGNPLIGREDYRGLPLLCGQPRRLRGAGTPQESVVPENWISYDPLTDTGYDWTGRPSAIDQEYINLNASSRALYVAVWEDENTKELKWMQM